METKIQLITMTEKEQRKAGEPWRQTEYQKGRPRAKGQSASYQMDLLTTVHANLLHVADLLSQPETYSIV